MTTNRRITIAAIPRGKLTTEHFGSDETPIPVPAAGELLLRTRVLSIDPANRAWMQGATYRDALAADTAMAGLAISEVVESRDPGFATGDIVFAETGWQEYATVVAGAATQQPADVPLTYLLSLYGTSTLTALHGLTDVSGVRAGETVLVSAAGGSVGIAAVQIVKRLGARVVGIAGGPDKCRWLKERFGIATIDHRAGDLLRAIRAACPDGVDVYFDNVGGEVLAAALGRMAVGGRIACCGAVSAYDGAKPAAGPAAVPGLLITRRLTMRGFILDDFAAGRDAALATIRAWVAEGALEPVEDVMHGLDQAPAALIRQLAGGNRGKAMVVVA